jgi:biopolymer transport protein ExbD
MARVFKRKDRLSAMSEINLTSLMDLVFCLLIIFMIATPLFQQQTIPLNLPKQARDANSQRDKNVRYQPVTIDPQGNYLYGNELVTGDQLLAHLQSLAAQPDPPVIDVRAEGSMPYQKIVDLTALIKQAGLNQISWDTQVR